MFVFKKRSVIKRSIFIFSARSVIFLHTSIFPKKRGRITSTQYSVSNSYIALPPDIKKNYWKRSTLANLSTFQEPLKLLGSNLNQIMFKPTKPHCYTVSHLACSSIINILSLHFFLYRLFDVSKNRSSKQLLDCERNINVLLKRETTPFFNFFCISTIRFV